MRQVRPYLMGASCDQIHFHQCQTILLVLREHLVACNHGLAAGERLVLDPDHLCLLVALMVGFQLGGLLLRYTHSHAEIGLLQFSVLDFLIEYAQAFGVLCADNYTRGIAVYAVAQGRCEAQLAVRVVFALVV